MEKKKVRAAIPKASKVRSELQKEIDSQCPFCQSVEVGHFQIHHIDENPSNNQIFNLILLCPTCHSKITKGDLTPLEVMNVKVGLLTKAEKKISPEKPGIINSNFVHSTIGDNNSISINTVIKKRVQKYPPGCIGYESIKANYISYLIDRYHKYKEFEIGAAKMNYAIFPTQLKNAFKIGSTRSIYNLSIIQFEELVQYIQKRIDQTVLSKKLGKNKNHYSSFASYSSNSFE